MITPMVNGTKVVFGPVRLSYTHLFSKYIPDGSTEGKYMTNVLIPKKEKETIKALQDAIQAAKVAGISSKWGGKEPLVLDLPLRDGKDKDEEIYKGCLFLNAKASTRPGVVDSDRNPITDEEEIYSGVWAYVSVSFYPYSVSGNKGVACGLNNVMKFKDDERLGGRVSAVTDFAGIKAPAPQDDDDDL